MCSKPVAASLCPDGVARGGLFAYTRAMPEYEPASGFPQESTMRKTIPLLLLAATVLLAAEKTPSPILSWVEAPPLAADKGEQRILDVLAQMAARDGRGDLNITPDDGRLLRLLAESAGARHVVEIGTSHGYSGLWFTLALRRTGGRLTTHEIDADRVETAGGNFRQAGVEDLVAIVRGDAHETVANVNEPVDIL
ncbi:MAG TPA: hypothetical protein ENN81_12270, partial [Phycisphaerales bacterium]|nr:hypothetical protein [Phycisphaerales bacterium]